MLEQVQLEQFNGVVRRLHFAMNFRKTLDEMQLSPDEEADIGRRLFGGAVPEDLRELIEDVFAPRVALGAPIARFSRNAFRTFYSALEWETCVAESEHGQRKHAMRLATAGVDGYRTAYFYGLECSFNGNVMDLRAVPDMPFLTDPSEDAYPRCNEVAEEARQRDAGGLLTTSARRAQGTCLPVFRKDCLAAPELVRRFRATNAEGEIHIVNAP